MVKIKEVEKETIFAVRKPIIPTLPEISAKTKVDVRYPLIQPYASVHIFWDDKQKEVIYDTIQPKLSEEERKTLKILEGGLSELINISFLSIKTTEAVISYLEKNLKVLIDEFNLSVSRQSFLRLMYYVYRDFVGLGKIEPMMNDYYIEDIECNGANTPIYIVHRKYGNLRTDVIYKDINELTRFVEKLAQKCGKYISYANPLLDAKLPDGSIDYEEPIIYKENGVVKISKIGEFVDKFYEKDNSNKPIPVNNLEVPAFDNKTLKINWKKVDYVYRHKNNDDLYELDLEFGRKIKLTKHHSIFVLTKEGVKTKKTEEISENDIVVSPLTIPENDIIKEINIAKELAETKYANELVLENVPRFIYNNKKIEIKKFYKNNYKKPHQAYYEHRNKKILPLKLYNLIEENHLKNCRIKPTSAVSIPTFIKIDKELIRFLGLYTAEGWLYNSSNVYAVYFSLHKDETDLIETIRNSSKKCFGLDIYVEPEEKNAVKVKVNSYSLWIFLNEILKVSKGASNKRIPELIFNINKELQQEFLKYWSLGDYGSTSSKQLSNDISYLSLFNNNIVPFYYREREAVFEKTRKVLGHEYYTNFFVRDINNTYSKMIPTSVFNPLNQSNYKFKNKRINRERIKKIIENIRQKINTNHSAFLYEWTKKGFFNADKPTNKFYELIKEFDIINKIAESDLGFFKINSIKRVKSSSEFVYDLSVKNHENFIGGYGGICCHNSRVNATYTQEISSRGPTFTIRKFTAEPWTPVKLMDMRTVSPEILAYLWILIEHESNIMVIGGTGSGKTTFLNTIAFFIPPAARIVSIEDTRELNLLHENWLPSVVRETTTGKSEVDLFTLLKESFRQRPDYVIVGEVRGKEAYVLFQGMNAGHPSFGTMHAENVETMIRRLESPPIELSPVLVESLDAVCVMVKARVKGETTRRIKHIAEIVKVPETGRAELNMPFVWDPRTDRFYFKTDSKVFDKISMKRGIPKEELLREFNIRARLLLAMYKNKVFGFKEVYKIINAYYKDPNSVLKQFGIS